MDFKDAVKETAKHMDQNVRQITTADRVDICSASNDVSAPNTNFEKAALVAGPIGFFLAKTLPGAIHNVEEAGNAFVEAFNHSWSQARNKKSQEKK